MKQVSDNIQDKNIEVITLGCRLNTYESEVISDLAKKAGIKDAIFINTCAVTQEAERQAKQTIRKTKKQNPDKRIIVTGCSAQINAKQYLDMPEVANVLGNEEKLKLDSYLELDSKKDIVSDIMQVKESATHLVSGFDGIARAFVQIQNGCDHRCTFCTIPYGRGNSRSVAIGEIVKQIKILLDNNYKEIVFTGVDLTSYGNDLPAKPSLGQMIKRVLNLLPDLKRLRLSSLDAVEIDEDLWDLIANEPRLMPHLHLSLQAGDDMILKRMKRRHLRQDAIDFCKKAKMLRPDVVLGADLIAGFPTESQEMFLNSLNIIDECSLSFLHVFPYSKRPNTPAARMPQVDKTIIKQRAKILREKALEQKLKLFKSFVNKECEVLVEKVDTDFSYGKTNHFVPVKWMSQSKVADVINIKIENFDNDGLIGLAF